MVYEALGAVLTWDTTTLVGVSIAMISTLGIVFACRSENGLEPEGE